MTEFVTLDGGRIAYDVIGDGPLVVRRGRTTCWPDGLRCCCGGSRPVPGTRTSPQTASATTSASPRSKK
jgi:hypothetical protein